MSTASEPHSGLSPKAHALLDGAVSIFAEDGYSRASIDKIARRAGVSSRTIYNQYSSKAKLFRAAIVASAHRVAELQITVVTDCLTEVGSASRLHASLIAFARAWGTPDPRAARHFALVRQVRAEVDHIPVEALQAWQEAGPRRVHAEIARHLQRIAELGLLEFDDAATAAAHLVALATAGADALQLRPDAVRESDQQRRAEAAVHTFLHGLGVPPH